MNFIKEKMGNGLICITFMTTGKQLADILTKGVPTALFHSFLDKLGMQNIFAPAWEGVLKIL